MSKSGPLIYSPPFPHLQGEASCFDQAGPPESLSLTHVPTQYLAKVWQPAGRSSAH